MSSDIEKAFSADCFSKSQADCQAEKCGDSSCCFYAAWLQTGAKKVAKALSNGGVCVPMSSDIEKAFSTDCFSKSQADCQAEKCGDSSCYFYASWLQTRAKKKAEALSNGGVGVPMSSDIEFSTNCFSKSQADCQAERCRDNSCYFYASWLQAGAKKKAEAVSKGGVVQLYAVQLFLVLQHVHLCP